MIDNYKNYLIEDYSVYSLRDGGINSALDLAVAGTPVDERARQSTPSATRMFDHDQEHSCVPV